MSANVAVVEEMSVGDEILPPWLEPTHAVKTPEVVVRPASYVALFGGY